MPLLFKIPDPGLVYIGSCGVHKLIATWCRICGSYYYRVQYPYTKSRGYSIWNP